MKIIKQGFCAFFIVFTLPFTELFLHRFKLLHLHFLLLMKEIQSTVIDFFYCSLFLTGDDLC